MQLPLSRWPISRCEAPLKSGYPPQYSRLSKVDANIYLFTLEYVYIFCKYKENFKLRLANSIRPFYSRKDCKIKDDFFALESQKRADFSCFLPKMESCEPLAMLMGKQRVSGYTQMQSS
jgi:hypothetical protein